MILDFIELGVTSRKLSTSFDEVKIRLFLTEIDGEEIFKYSYLKGIHHKYISSMELAEIIAEEINKISSVDDDITKDISISLFKNLFEVITFEIEDYILKDKVYNSIKEDKDKSISKERTFLNIYHEIIKSLKKELDDKEDNEVNESFYYNKFENEMKIYFKTIKIK